MNMYLGKEAQQQLGRIDDALRQGLEAGLAMISTVSQLRQPGMADELKGYKRFLEFLRDNAGHGQLDELARILVKFGPRRAINQLGVIDLEETDLKALDIKLCRDQLTKMIHRKSQNMEV